MRSNASTTRGRCRSRGPDLSCGRDRCVGRSSAAARPPVPGFPRANAGRPSAWIERRGRGGRRGCVPGRGRSSRSVLAATWWAVRARSSRAAQEACGLSGCLGVFVVAFGDPLIQVGGVGVAAVRAGLDGAQRCGRHPGTRSPSSQCACFGEQTATGSGSSAYTSRTALLTKRRAVRSSEPPGYQACMMRGEMWPRRQETFSRLTQAHRAVPS